MTQGGGPIKVGTPQVHTLASTMDDVSFRMQDVLNRYQDANEQAIAMQTMGGQAAMTSRATGAEIHDAQMKIQQRFQMINDTLRTGATQYSNTDQDNAHNIASIAGHIQFR